MRIGCTVFAISYGIVSVLRAEASDLDFTWLRLAIVLYGVLGVFLSRHVTWSIQRAYTVGLALGFPLQAAYIDAMLGNSVAEAALTAIATFVSLIFLQTARDFILVDVLLVIGNAAILAVAPAPAIPLSIIVVILGAAITTATVTGIHTLLYRGRGAESLAQLEDTLRISAGWQHRYEAATSASGQVLYDWEPSTNQVSYGGAFERILGYSRTELGGGLEHWNRIVHPDDVGRFNDAIEAVLAHKSSFHLRYRVRRKDGGFIVVEDNGHFVLDEDGEIVRMVGFVADVTERTRAENLRAEEAATSAALARVGRELISSLETPIVMERLCRLTTEVLECDFSQTWIWQAAGSAYAPLAGFGLSHDEWDEMRTLRVPSGPTTPLVARLECEDLVEIDAATTEYPMVGSLLTSYGASTIVCASLRRGGELIGIQIAGYRTGATSFSGGQRRIARGIAQLASMALTNAQLVEELERASQLKSQFVSTMSHELRTPLNVILGYTDMLGDEPLSPNQRLSLSRMRHSSLELLEMIEATLDLSRITAGTDMPTFEPVSVSALWNELCSEFAALPRSPAIQLLWEQACHHGTLCTDRRKLKMIVKNLVGNALKFTPSGNVIVSCLPTHEDFVFTVRDAGIGIPTEHLSSIFEMFRQVDSSDARSYSGAGLGLYIVRRLVDQLGGTIAVESELGRGSTFRVTLPAAPKGGQIAA